jgi:DNA-directed RNA polymerase specialized sigma24 family protein
MKNRWFGVQRELKQASSRPNEPLASQDATARPSRFPREEAFWRSWLATGARRVPIDRRRARGAEAQLKKILVGEPSGAVDFSSAMARQAIDEALHELPPLQKQVVKLAYFGGLTNREIAQELGLSVSEVRRTLQASLASVGAHFERGRAKGRRAIQDLALLPLWRSFGDHAQRASWPGLDHVLQTGVVAVMTAAAAALLVTHQAPVHAGHTHRPVHVAAVGAAGSTVTQAHQATLVDVVSSPASTAPIAVKSGLHALPVKVSSPVAQPVIELVKPLLSKLPSSGVRQLPFGA